MKFDLSNYEVLLPPYPLEYQKWDEAQAQDYLKWFIGKIPERVDYVCWRYHKDNFFSRKLDPNDPESLLRIWRWFLPRAKIEQMPKEEAEAHLAAYSYLGGTWLDTRQLSPCTECVTRDIGMLMGHIFTANFSQQLYWTTEKGVKHYIWRWHPVLKGFIYTANGKPVPFEPLHLVYTQASGLLQKKAKVDDLRHFYSIWETYVPIS